MLHDLQMAMSMQQQLYPPTEILFQRGDNISTLYVIMRGIVISAGRVHVKGMAYSTLWPPIPAKT